jgi:hypothetical protein
VYGREEECKEELVGIIGIRNRSEDLGVMKIDFEYVSSMRGAVRFS